MMNNERLDRISLNPAVMGGKPCIRGTRVTVGRIVSQIGAGETIEELLADYPYIEREDILQALRIHLLPFNYTLPGTAAGETPAAGVPQLGQLGPAFHAKCHNYSLFLRAANIFSAFS
jgi:uncharacterized protein (DUF433 family)